jgi:hypothetical protein
MNERMPFRAPDYRATLVEDRLRLIPWSPMLLGSCGQGNGLRQVSGGPQLVDLTVVRNDELQTHELLVTELASAPDRRLRGVIISWASLLGYERIWFSDDVVTLDPAAAGAIELAAADCPTCAARWSDDCPEFWLSARHYGVFPLWCRICGHPLPQWTVDAGSVTSDQSMEPATAQTTATTVTADEMGGGR